MAAVPPAPAAAAEAGEKVGIAYPVWLGATVNSNDQWFPLLVVEAVEIVNLKSARKFVNGGVTASIDEGKDDVVPLYRRGATVFALDGIEAEISGSDLFVHVIVRRLQLRPAERQQIEPPPELAFGAYTEDTTLVYKDIKYTSFPGDEGRNWPKDIELPAPESMILCRANASTTRWRLTIKADCFSVAHAMLLVKTPFKTYNFSPFSFPGLALDIDEDGCSRLLQDDTTIPFQHLRDMAITRAAPERVKAILEGLISSHVSLEVPKDRDAVRLQVARVNRGLPPRASKLLLTRKELHSFKTTPDRVFLRQIDLPATPALRYTFWRQKPVTKLQVLAVAQCIAAQEYNPGNTLPMLVMCVDTYCKGIDESLPSSLQGHWAKGQEFTKLVNEIGMDFGEALSALSKPGGLTVGGQHFSLLQRKVMCPDALKANIQEDRVDLDGNILLLLLGSSHMITAACLSGNGEEWNGECALLSDIARWEADVAAGMTSLEGNHEYQQFVEKPMIMEMQQNHNTSSSMVGGMSEHGAVCRARHLWLGKNKPSPATAGGGAATPILDMDLQARSTFTEFAMETISMLDVESNTSSDKEGNGAKLMMLKNDLRSAEAALDCRPMIASQVVDLWVGFMNAKNTKEALSHVRTILNGLAKDHSGVTGANVNGKTDEKVLREVCEAIITQNSSHSGFIRRVKLGMMWSVYARKYKGGIRLVDNVIYTASLPADKYTLYDNFHQYLCRVASWKNNEMFEVKAKECDVPTWLVNLVNISPNQAAVLKMSPFVTQDAFADMFRQMKNVPLAAAVMERLCSRKALVEMLGSEKAETEVSIATLTRRNASVHLYESKRQSLRNVLIYLESMIFDDTRVSQRLREEGAQAIASLKWLISEEGLSSRVGKYLLDCIAMPDVGNAREVATKEVNDTLGSNGSVMSWVLT